MRIVAELPHPDFKITLFSMNQKYIVKFEQGQLEQSYKLSELDLTGGGANEVFQILDDTFFLLLPSVSKPCAAISPQLIKDSSKNSYK